MKPCLCRYGQCMSHTSFIIKKKFWEILNEGKWRKTQHAAGRDLKRSNSHTHWTKPSFLDESIVLIGGRPVISSRSTTPYEYTSDFSVTLPLDAYSGARYLYMYSKRNKWLKKLHIIIVAKATRYMTTEHSWSYPNVPTTRVERWVMWVLVSENDLASPKSETWT